VTTTQSPPRTGLVLTPDEAGRTAEPALEVAGRYPASDDPELLQEAPLSSARLPERVRNNTVTSEADQQFFAGVNEPLEQSRRRCPPATGDFVFLNNHWVVHARTCFTARYDGTDRRLKRINITHDLRKSADLRRPATPRLIG
jgi:hypothetical protein